MWARGRELADDNTVQTVKVFWSVSLETEAAGARANPRACLYIEYTHTYFTF